MKVPLCSLDFLERAETVYPDRIAVVDEPAQPATPLSQLTYAQLGQRVRALSAGLDALDIAQGARIAVVSHNSARLLELLYSVPAFGRIFVPINFRLKPGEIEYIVNHCGAEMLLVDPELAEVVSGLKVKHRLVLGEESDRLHRFDSEPRPWQPDEDATATINYTSGTTAMPKGVQITHRNIWSNASTFGWHLGINDRDIYLHTLPMFHCNGWGMPFALAGMGAGQIVLRQVDGPEILRRIERHGVTVLCGAPAVANIILDAAESWDGPIPGSGRVRMVVAGAAPPTRTLERMETVLGWEVCQIYGLTETSPLLTINRPRGEWDDLSPSERAQKLNRAGAPVIGARLRSDESGEICARSNVIMQGYWEQPEATAEAIRDGWFHTGDGGVVDDEGYVHIQDRKKDVIISGGENVSSIEVEDVLFTHPAISEVAVIGVPDEKWGETVKALVVSAGEVSERELIDYCRERLAHYKCPTSIEFRSELARTATGKLQKFKLREPYWKDMDRQVN
ncbi:MAG: AMP-binding protein [Gammaproteobacteria bacterium AqS3]|nr:AMP-binding protein [Gammaproteobacteria bacterium AqS3]